MAGLLDAIFPSSDGGGLLDFLKRNAMNQQPLQNGAPGDTAQYGAAPQMPQQGLIPQAPVPQNPPPVIRANLPPMAAPGGTPQAPVTAGPGAGATPQSPMAAPIAPAMLTPATPGGGGFLGNLARAISNIPRGGADDPNLVAQRQQAQTANLTQRMLLAHGYSPEDAAALVQPGNADNLKTAMTNIWNRGSHTQKTDKDGNVWDHDNLTGEDKLLLNNRDKTPPDQLNYQYYLDNFKPTPEQPKPEDFRTYQLEKTKAGANNVVTTVDNGSGQTYDRKMTDALGGSHAGLMSDVPAAQSRARDIAAMQGALDAIQRNGGTTGGMGQQQILDLKKSINEGANTLGLPNPFDEGDISDKEFLTKFNRQLAGAMAKGTVGGRVTNFEMGNFLKANPGIDMSATGNQRLLGIQAQIEQRNIAVGNAIRNMTAQAVSQGKKVDPAVVEKMIEDYDNAHHIHDPVTGQDITQSAALPEFQNVNQSNKELSAAHTQNMKHMEKTIGNRTAFTEDGGKTWSWKDSN